MERLQIVELPQLLNVLFDGMSFIGNRPLPERNVNLLRQHHHNWAERFASPAGITGIAQVAGKLFLDPVHRLQLEAGYSAVYKSGNILRCDFLILWYTLKVVVTGKGISPMDAYRIVNLDPPDLASMEPVRKETMVRKAAAGQ
jgi:lipopolysaccharide/colanic/teichoic acid biosynthesis glycosyltransferase